MLTLTSTLASAPVRSLARVNGVWPLSLSLSRLFPCCNSLSLQWLAAIAFLLIAGFSGASGQSCYTMLYPDEPFGQTANPDSVKVNTCDSLGGLYAKGWFSVSFTKCVIPPEYAPADSAVFVSWQGIDTSFQALRSFFDSLEQEYGAFTLRKVMPQITDTSLPGVKEYHLRFDDEVSITSVEQFFTGAPDIAQCVYIIRAGMVLSNPTFYHPDDRAFQVGIANDFTNFNEVKFDATKSDEVIRKRRLGGYEGLYLSHVPLAWEITRGNDNISIGIEDFWSNPGESQYLPIPAGKEHPDINSENFKEFGKEPTNNGKVVTKVLQRYGHGLGIAGVLAGIEHSADHPTHPKFGTIGVAPGIKKLFGTNGNVICPEGYGCIDTDPNTTGIQPPDIVTCSTFPGADNSSWKRGVVEVGAVGNFTTSAGWTNNLPINISKPTDPVQFDWVLDEKGWRHRDKQGNKTNATHTLFNQWILLLAIPHGGATKPYDLNEVDIYAVIQKGPLNSSFACGIMKDETFDTKAIGATQVNYIPSKHKPPYWPSCTNNRYTTEFNLRTHYFTEFVNTFTMPSTLEIDAGKKMEKFHSQGISNGKLNQGAFSDIIVHGGIMATNYLEPEPDKPNTDNRPYPIVWGLGGSSFAAPVVAGTVGLMRSVNRYLGAPLTSNNIPVDPREMQVRAYNTVTFTAEKEVDYLATNPNAMHQYYDWIYIYTIPDSIADMNLSNPFLGLRVNKVAYLEATQSITGYPIYKDGGVWKVDNVESHKATLKNEYFDFNKMALNYTVQTPDKLKRSWAHRHGFGHLNSYRAVIHSVPNKGDHEYTGTAAWTSSWNFSTLIDTRKVLHLGSLARERNEQRNGTGGTTDVFKVLEYGGYRFERGANSPYNAPDYENNNGETLFNPASDAEFLVGEGKTLAIDGIVQQTQSSKKRVTIKTTADESGKILATGYLDEVTLSGTMKLDHLNVYADDVENPKGSIVIEGTTPSELWGRLKLYGNAIVDIKSGGKLVVRAGGEIHLEGNKDLTINDGATLELGHGSIIRTKAPRNADGVPTGPIEHAIVVETGGKLVVPDNVFFQQIDGKVIVKDGGQFIIGKNSSVQMAQFEVQAGGKLILDEGCTLELDEYESICDGHLIANSAVKQTNGSYEIWPSAPPANPARITITGLRECGKPAGVASIKCSYDIATLPIAPMPQSINQIQASLKLRYTDVENVKFNVVNVYTPPVEHCNFSADRATVKSKTYRQKTDNGEVLAKLDALFVYDFERDKYRPMIRSSATRPAYFLMRQTGIAKLDFQHCKFFDQNTQNLPRHYGLDPDNTYAFDGARLSNCFSVLIGDASSEPSTAPNCDFQHLHEAIITNQCDLVEVLGSNFDYNNTCFTDNGSAVKICTNEFSNSHLGGSFIFSAQGITQRNTYANMQACTDLRSSARHFIRGNTMTTFLWGLYHDNSETVVRSEGLEWDYENNRWGRREYGKNQFITNNELATNPFRNGTNYDAVDIQFSRASDYSFIPCGYNRFAEESRFHLHKINNGALSRTMATRFNHWLHSADPNGFVRHETNPEVVPISGRENPNNWEQAKLPNPNTCSKHLFDECDPDPQPEPCPECPKLGPWAHEEHDIIYLIGVIPGIIGKVNDTTSSVYERKEAIAGLTYAVIHADTNGVLTDSLDAMLTAIATGASNDGLLRSTAYLRLGIVRMNDGNHAGAVAAFDSVRTLNNNTPDSAIASWLTMQANARLSDTTHGFVFDSLMNSSYTASLQYRIGTPLPDSSSAKPGAPIVSELTALSGMTIQSVLPNPINNAATVVIYLPAKTEHLRLTLHDALGNVVMTVAQGSFAAGQHSIIMPITGLMSGMYHVRLMSWNGELDTRTVVIMQ